MFISHSLLHKPNTTQHANFPCKGNTTKPQQFTLTTAHAVFLFVRVCALRHSSFCIDLAKHNRRRHRSQTAREFISKPLLAKLQRDRNKDSKTVRKRGGKEILKTRICGRERNSLQQWRRNKLQRARVCRLVCWKDDLFGNGPIYRLSV